MKLMLCLVSLCVVSALANWSVVYGQRLPLLILTKEAADGHLTLVTMTASLPVGEWQLHQPPTGSAY